MNMLFIYSALPALLRGTIVTLQIGAIGCLIGTVGGTLLGIGQTSKNKFLQLMINIYATIIRGTPMLIQIGLIHYVVLPVIGINTSAFVSAVLAIGINSTAYVSQIIRSGIQSIDRGQVEAAQTLGLTQTQTIRFIVLPQALRNVIPALGNELITLIKDSSLASTIGAYELLKQGSIIISQTFNSIGVYCLVGIIYLIITTSLSVLLNILERKMSWYVKN